MRTCQTQVQYIVHYKIPHDPGRQFGSYLSQNVKATPLILFKGRDLGSNIRWITCWIYQLIIFERLLTFRHHTENTYPLRFAQLLHRLCQIPAWHVPSQLAISIPSDL